MGACLFHQPAERLLGEQGHIGIDDQDQVSLSFQ